MTLEQRELLRQLEEEDARDADSAQIATNDEEAQYAEHLRALRQTTPQEQRVA